MGLRLRSSRRRLGGNRPWWLSLHRRLLGCTLNGIAPNRLAGCWCLVLLGTAGEGRKFAKRGKIERQSIVPVKFYKIVIDLIGNFAARTPKLVHDGYTRGE